jgi:hypothetical protein
MKFKFDQMDLSAALDVVSKVKPTGLKSSKEEKNPTAVYLFSVRDDKCYIYSRGGPHVIRADFPVTDVEGDLMDFTYPVSAISAFRYLKGMITMEASKDGDKYKVAYAADEGASGERFTLNPKLIARCEDQMADLKNSVVFPSKVLQLGLDTTKLYLPAKDNKRCPSHFKTVQIYDSKIPDLADGDGIMLAADGVRMGYLECSAYKGKSLPIFMDHVGVIASFLSTCEGDVTVLNGEQQAFFEDSKGRVLGITHQAELHPKFKKRNPDEDTVVLRLDKEALVAVLRHIEASLPEKQKRVRLTYNHARGALTVSMSESSTQASMTVIALSKEGKDPKDFKLTAEIDKLLDLFVPMLCNEVKFRVRLYVKGSKTSGILVTVDHYWVDNLGKVAADNTLPDIHECTMTRVLPSME